MTVGGGGCKRTLGAEEFAGDVEGLGADHNDLLAVEELLGHDTGEATKEVALAVDDNLRSDSSQPIVPSSWMRICACA